MHDDRLIDYLFNFFNSVFVNDLFLDDLDFLDGRHLNLNLNNLFDVFRYLNHLFDNFFDGDHFFNDHFNDVRNFDRLINNLASVAIFDNLDWLLDNNFDDLGYFNYFFNDFFLQNWHFDNLAQNAFDRYYFLPDDFYFFDFSNKMVYILFNNYWLFNFNKLFDNYFYFHNLWDFNDSINDLFLN